MKLWFQSLAGFVVVIGSFVLGAFLTTVIPEAGGKYMSPLGQAIVGALIFADTLGLAMIARFPRSALFLSLGFTVIFEVILLSVLSGGYWWGDLMEVWDHTLLPVALSATTVVVIQAVRGRRGAEPGAPPNGGRAMRLRNSGAGGGPPSVT